MAGKTGSKISRLLVLVSVVPPGRFSLPDIISTEN